MSDHDSKLLVYDDLAAYGIHYHRDTLRRRVRAGTFPAPVELSGGRVAWRIGDIRAWVNSLQERGAGWTDPKRAA